jgi:hypothetical protein
MRTAIDDVFATYTRACASRDDVKRAMSLASDRAREIVASASDADVVEEDVLDVALDAFAQLTRGVSTVITRDAYDGAYACVFMFARSHRGRGVARARAARAWRGVFGERLRAWTTYVERERGDVSMVSYDTWMQTLEFARQCEIKGYGLEWYDFSEAWPTLIDEFVEARRASDEATAGARSGASDDFGGRITPPLALGGGDWKRKRTIAHAHALDAGGEDDVVGLANEFEREAQIRHAPKRACSNMSLDNSAHAM